MREIFLSDNMKFVNDKNETSFIVHKYDYYGNNEKIWCAFTDKSIYPLKEICISDYSPIVDGEIIKSSDIIILG